MVVVLIDLILLGLLLAFLLFRGAIQEGCKAVVLILLQ